MFCIYINVQPATYNTYNGYKYITYCAYTTYRSITYRVHANYLLHIFMLVRIGNRDVRAIRFEITSEGFPQYLFIHTECHL